MHVHNFFIHYINRFIYTRIFMQSLCYVCKIYIVKSLVFLISLRGERGTIAIDCARGTAFE